MANAATPVQKAASRHSPSSEASAEDRRDARRMG